VLSTSEQHLSSATDLAAELAHKEGKKPQNRKVAMVFEILGDELLANPDVGRLFLGG